VFSYL